MYYTRSALLSCIYGVAPGELSPPPATLLCSPFLASPFLPIKLKNSPVKMYKQSTHLIQQKSLMAYYVLKTSVCKLGKEEVAVALTRLMRPRIKLMERFIYWEGLFCHYIFDLPAPFSPSSSSSYSSAVYLTKPLVFRIHSPSANTQRPLRLSRYGQIVMQT